MPLESCPICGYAVSTVTFQCRHCPPGAQVKGLGMNWTMQVIGYTAAIACVIYLCFFR
jgi:hypothetical protein